MHTPFAHILANRLGEDVVAAGDAIPERFHRDWSGLAPVRPLALVRPRDTSGVAAAVRLCHEHGVPVVSQGGLTGLAGGAHPLPDGVVLSLERMTAIEEIDPAMATVTVQCGASLEMVQQAADTAGLLLALDLGARGSCTIGGNIATNAGGNRVIRYGMTREHVLGLEVVLADGAVISSLNKMLKNNAGYDLKQLFIGSEGTLGIITRAVLKLQPRPDFSATAFCGCRDFETMIELLKASRAALGPSLTSFEVMWPSFYDFMSAGLPHLRRAFPLDHGVYVLIEVSGFDGVRERERLESMLGKALEAGHADDAVIAASQKEVAELWAVREAVSEYSRLLGPLTAFDVGIPAHRTGSVVAAIEDGLRRHWPDAVVLSYGHIGDSNLHVVVNVPSFGLHQPHAEISDFVYARVREAGGTVSAEHGIGLLKRAYLSYSRSPEEIDLMRRMKKALDPRGILNPGKVLPA